MLIKVIEKKIHLHVPKTERNPKFSIPFQVPADCTQYKGKTAQPTKAIRNTDDDTCEYLAG